MKREQLISICERCHIPESKWQDDYVRYLMLQAGQLYSLLKCGCEFTIITAENATTLEATEGNVSNECVIYLRLNVLSETATNLPLEQVDERNAGKQEVIFAIPTEHDLATNPMFSKEASAPVPPMHVVEETTTPVAETTTEPVAETPTPVVEQTTTPKQEKKIIPETNPELHEKEKVSESESKQPEVTLDKKDNPIVLPDKNDQSKNNSGKAKPHKNNSKKNK